MKKGIIFIISLILAFTLITVGGCEDVTGFLNKVFSGCSWNEVETFPPEPQPPTPEPIKLKLSGDYAFSMLESNDYLPRVKGAITSNKAIEKLELYFNGEVKLLTEVNIISDETTKDYIISFDNSFIYDKINIGVYKVGLYAFIENEYYKIAEDKSLTVEYDFYHAQYIRVDTGELRDCMDSDDFWTSSY